VLVLAALLRPVVAGSTGDTLRAPVSQIVGVAPAVVRVVVTVEPVDATVAVEWSWTPLPVTAAPLNSVASPHACPPWQFRAVAEGAYEVRVSVAGANGQTRAQVRDRVLILR
jgi:hypothetical protein